MAQKQKQLKRRYGVIYYFQSDLMEPDAWGSTNSFESACGNAARHVAKSDFNAGEYRTAVIVDKIGGNIVRAYKRGVDGIKIKDFVWIAQPDDL